MGYEWEILQDTAKHTWLNDLIQIHSEGPLPWYTHIRGILDIDNGRRFGTRDGEEPRCITSIETSLSRCTAKSTLTTRGIPCGPLNESIGIEVSDK